MHWTCPACGFDQTWWTPRRYTRAEVEELIADGSVRQPWFGRGVVQLPGEEAWVADIDLTCGGCREDFFLGDSLALPSLRSALPLPTVAQARADIQVEAQRLHARIAQRPELAGLDQMTAAEQLYLGGNEPEHMARFAGALWRWMLVDPPALSLQQRAAWVRRAAIREGEALSWLDRDAEAVAVLRNALPWCVPGSGSAPEERRVLHRILAACLLRLGRPAEALPEAEQAAAIEDDPGDDWLIAAVEVMRSHDALGSSVEALRAADECRRRIAWMVDHDHEVEASTLHLVEAISLAHGRSLGAPPPAGPLAEDPATALLRSMDAAVQRGLDLEDVRDPTSREQLRSMRAQVERMLDDPGADTDGILSCLRATLAITEALITPGEGDDELDPAALAEAEALALEAAGRWPQSWRAQGAGLLARLQVATGRATGADASPGALLTGWLAGRVDLADPAGLALAQGRAALATLRTDVGTEAAMQHRAAAQYDLELAVFALVRAADGPARPQRPALLAHAFDLVEAARATALDLPPTAGSGTEAAAAAWSGALRRWVGGEGSREAALAALAELRRVTARMAQPAVPPPARLDLAEALRAALPAGDLVVSYFIGTQVVHNASLALLVDQQGVDVVHLPGGRDDIRAALERVLRGLEESMAWPAAALAELAALVLDPIVPHFRRRASGGEGRLVILPDRDLATCPFQALPLATGRPLGAHRVVVACPSARRLLGQLHQDRAQSGRGPGPRQVLAYGGMSYDADQEHLLQTGKVRLGEHTVDLESLDACLDPSCAPPADPALSLRRRASAHEALPMSIAEVRRIRVACAAARPRPVQCALRVGAQAGRDALEADLLGLSEPAVIHVAAHGHGDPDEPRLSALVLSTVDAEGRPVDGVLCFDRIRRLDWRRAHLVVLSACETQLGRPRPGEGIVALPWALQAAGAGAVLATLRPVPDQPIAQVMGWLYDALVAEDMDPAVALHHVFARLWPSGETGGEPQVTPELRCTAAMLQLWR